MRRCDAHGSRRVNYRLAYGRRDSLTKGEPNTRRKNAKRVQNPRITEAGVPFVGDGFSYKGGRRVAFLELDFRYVEILGGHGTALSGDDKLQPVAVITGGKQHHQLRLRIGFDRDNLIGDLCDGGKIIFRVRFRNADFIIDGAAHIVLHQAMEDRADIFKAPRIGAFHAIAGCHRAA